MRCMQNHTNDVSPCRTDLRHLDVYTIDPPGCTDADDGFSVIEKDGSTVIALHYADPTHIISPKSTISKKVQTRYSIFEKTKPMLTCNISERVSLKSNKKETRHAITLQLTLAKDTHMPINPPEILFTVVTISPRNSFTYHRAGSILQGSNTCNRLTLQRFRVVQRFATALMNAREATHWRTLSRVCASRRGIVSLKAPSQEETYMRKIVGELSIYANKQVANILSTTLGNDAIYRSTVGDYVLRNTPNENMNNEVYTHFTSPMRRWVDCVTHFLLKSIFHHPAHNSSSFSRSDLQSFIDNSNKMAKTIKETAIQENKLALNLYIYQLTIKGMIVCIDYVISNVVPTETEIRVRRIDDHEVRFDYSIPHTINMKPNPHKVFRALVSSIDLNTGKMPDLDKYILGEKRENTFKMPQSHERNVVSSNPEIAQ